MRELLYDVHANLLALQVVLREVEVASPTERDRRRRRDGPLNAETINALMALGDRAVFGRGNADRWTGEPYDDPSSASPGGEQGRRAAAWAATQLGQGVDDTTAEPACAQLSGWQQRVHPAGTGGVYANFLDGTQPTSTAPTGAATSSAYGA